jgi:hypothetical protein
MSDEFIVVTSIKCDKKVTIDGEERVILDYDADNGDTAIWLENPTKYGDRSYHAKLIDYNTAKDSILDRCNKRGKIPLFCVHGYSVQPNDVIDHIIDHRDGKKGKDFFSKSKYYPVFVIWPSAGQWNDKQDTVTGYADDSDVHAPKAGVAFNDFVRNIPDTTFPRKSLMMHSMGNHVVFNGACRKSAPEVQFENIFMVAADVPHDIFHKDPWEGHDGNNKNIWGRKKEKANNFYQMLAKEKSSGKPKGKVVVLYNGSDKALAFSSWYENNERRIGQRGMGTGRNWRLAIVFQPELVLDKYKNYYNNEDCNSWAGAYVGTGHSYQFADKAIDIYDKYGL